jgi:hypothetical protein
VITIRTRLTLVVVFATVAGGRRLAAAQHR